MAGWRSSLPTGMRKSRKSSAGIRQRVGERILSNMSTDSASNSRRSWSYSTPTMRVVSASENQCATKMVGRPLLRQSWRSDGGGSSTAAAAKKRENDENDGGDSLTDEHSLHPAVDRARQHQRSHHGATDSDQRLPNRLSTPNHRCPTKLPVRTTRQEG